MKLQDTTFTCQPTNVEWETAEFVCSLLEVFLDATMVVSRTLYPTSHLYFHEHWKIHLILQRETKHKDIVIKSMVEAMQEEVHEVLEAVILDHLSSGHTRPQVQV